ncbi:MAG: hypothetical protein ABI746_07750 [Dermatophilaceae bacterium]
MTAKDGGHEGGHDVGERVSRDAAVISGAAFDAMVRGELGVIDGAADRAVLAEYGFLDAHGVPTRAVEDLVEDLSDAAVLRLRHTDEQGPARGAELIVGRTVVVAVEPDRRASGNEGPGEGAERAAERDHWAGAAVRFDVLPADAIPLWVARWWGIVPRLPTDRMALGPWPEEDVWRRLADPTTPPPADADEATLAMWVLPWRAWGVHCPERTISRTYLDVRDECTYVLHREGSGVLRAVPRPSSLIWGDLQTISAEVRGRDDADGW